jgi:enoyl-CoA hydratase
LADPVLLYEADAGIATLTMNRPAAMNALSREMRDALALRFQELRDDDSVRVVILTGSGDRAFCAGLDLKELGGESEAGGESSDATQALGSGDNVVRAMEELGKPIICAINGVAITGGFELALAGDVLIGSTHARFADTHARVGIMPGWGLSQKLSRLVGIYRAKELSLTGNFLLAEQAERWGLLSRVVAPDDLMSTCRSLAEDMLSCQPEMVVAYKDVIDRGFAIDYAAARQLERDANRDQAKEITPDKIAEARKTVTARGREQARP